jgi:acetone carboxylase gamma subunit
MDCNDCGHCKDLHGDIEGDPQEVRDAREMVRTHLREWLGLPAPSEQIDLKFLQ